MSTNVQSWAVAYTRVAGTMSNADALITDSLVDDHVGSVLGSTQVHRLTTSNPWRISQGTTSPEGVSIMGVPVIGGLIDSVVGILTGTVYGVAGAALAVVHSIIG